MDNKLQKIQYLALTQGKKGEARSLPVRRKVLSAALHSTESSAHKNGLMETICDRENLIQALERVRKNKGAPGIDGMTIDDLSPYLKDNWLVIKEQLLKGSYAPKPVRQVEIPKSDGKVGVRELGIPCVLDRFIQQAILQVLQREIDPTFSEYSFGFRPGRSAHQAIAKAQEYIAQGYRIVVDIDLEKFFNTICHDKLMSEMAKRISDKRVLKILRAFLNAGIMQNGLVKHTEQGTQQGSPLSPLLSNVMLDLLDRELENRRHRFCRYADDCNVYVKSERAGHRVMKSLQTFIIKLKLKINEKKSAVAKVYRRSFLGFTFTSGKVPKRRIAPQAIERFKKKIRQYTRASKGVCMEEVIINLGKYLNGWQAYFGFCQTPSVMKDLESGIRRRLRCAFWRQWKHGKNRGIQLRQRGVEYNLSIQTAGSNKGPWHISMSPALCIAMPNTYFKALGLPELTCSK